MAEEKITDTKKVKNGGKTSPSFWFNILVLVVLFGLIVGAQHMAKQWAENAPPPIEDMDRQIVLEDLESDAPLAESEMIQVDQEIEDILESEPKKKAVFAIKKNPYTDGGALDLDNPKNRELYFPGSPKESLIRIREPREVRLEATASSLFSNTRDQFIPFESE